MKFTRIQLAVFAILGAQLIWGTAPPIFKWSMQSIEPFTLGFIRFLIASILLLPFVYKQLAVERKTFFLLVLTAFISVPLHIGLFLTGLQYAPSLNVPIIGASGPVFTIIFSALFFHEKLKRNVILGTGISLIGVLLIVLQPILETGFDGSFYGNLLFLCSTFTGIAHLFLLKKITKSYSSMTITYWTFLFGTFFFLPLMLWEMYTNPAAIVVDQYSLTGIIFGGVLSSGLGWLLHAYAVQQLKPNDIAIFSYMGPIITALVAIPLLGETITFAFLLGSVLVFLGIFIAEARVHHHPSHKLFT